MVKRGLVCGQRERERESGVLFLCMFSRGFCFIVTVAELTWNLIGKRWREQKPLSVAAAPPSGDPPLAAAD